MAVLETDRLLLRRFNVDDARFILTLVNEPSFLRYIGSHYCRVGASHWWTVAHFMGSHVHFILGPGVPLAKPRFTPGYMLAVHFADSCKPRFIG